jgi:hypothetical protein
LDTDKRGLLLPYNASKLNTQKSGIHETADILTKLYEREQALSKPHKEIKLTAILIMDACRIETDKTETKKVSTDEKFSHISRLYSSLAGQYSEQAKKPNEEKTQEKAQPQDKNAKVADQPQTSRFTKYFLEAIKAENKKEANASQNEKDKTEKEAIGLVSDTDGNRMITLSEIGKYIEAKMDKEEQTQVDIHYGSNYHFNLIIMDKYPPARWYHPVKSFFLPGWGFWDYGNSTKYYKQKDNHSEVWFKAGAGVTLLGLVALANQSVKDNQTFKKKKSEYVNASVYPAQVLGYDTILFNYIMLEQKRSDMRKTSLYYNTSATALGVAWALNVIGSYAVPYFFNKTEGSGVSIDMNYRHETIGLYTIEKQGELRLSYRF